MTVFVVLIPVSLFGFGLWWAKKDGLDLRNDPGSGIEPLRLSETSISLSEASISEDTNRRR